MECLFLAWTKPPSVFHSSHVTNIPFWAELALVWPAKHTNLKKNPSVLHQLHVLTCTICLGWNSGKFSWQQKLSEWRQQSIHVTKTLTKDYDSNPEMSSRTFPGSRALPAAACRRAEVAGFGPGLLRLHQIVSGGQRSAGQDTELEENLCSPDQLGEHLHMWSRK